MKRLLTLVLLMLLFVTPAAANSWGLKGPLLSAVMDDDTWDNYHAMGDQVDNVAAMTSRYHNALMLVMDKNAPLEVYTRALWQPDDERGSAKLTRTEDGFTLSYGQFEMYTFVLRNGGYVLESAVIGDFFLELVREDGLYLACKGVDCDETAQWFVYGGLPLEEFSIRLLPRSVEEVRRLNQMNAALDSFWEFSSWSDPMQPGRMYTGLGKKTVPVYAAPSESAWRASKGKASVSLKGDVWVLRKWADAAGDAWFQIRYDVSQRTQRFGFIRAEDVTSDDLANFWVWSVSPQEMSVPVRTAVATTLTDDPLVSQYVQAEIPAGTELLCIATLNEGYALVQTDIGGKEAWLYVPLKDLEPVMGDPQPDVMALLDGCWYYAAGGSMASDYLRLNADGTFYDPSWPETRGTWAVTAYDPARGLYWNDPPYEITLCYADGRCNVKGLSLDTDPDTGEPTGGFSLTNWEGGGGYEPIDEGDVPLREHAEGNG